MSTPSLRLSSPPGGPHPAVLNRRIQDGLAIATAAGISLALALGIALAMPNPSLMLVLGVIVAAVGVVFLIMNPRLELSVGFLVVYLGCLEGPVKLVSAGGAVTAALRNVLILSVCLGILLRRAGGKRPMRLPALGGWVLAFVLIVLVEAFNPKTHGLLKVVAGFRQQLQWVPFFFFAYLLMRSTDRFRKLFLLLGVIALANGAVATLQTQLSASQLASWGPGYSERVNGTAGQSARKYLSEGQARVRPLGLGSDSGFSGAVGVIALPATLALLVISRRRRWLPMVLCLGTLAGVATSLGRNEVASAMLAVVGFAFFSATAGRRIGRPLAALAATFVVALPLGAVFISAVGEGVFSRYTSIAPSKVESAASYKETSWKQIPKDIVNAPFGFGLSTTGAASGFGGKTTELLEGHGISAETQYNFIVDELGLPGLIVYTAFLLRLITLASSRLRDVADADLQICLVAVFAPLVAYFFAGFEGPVLASAAAGPFFWFAAGVAAYWLAGPGRALARRVRPGGASQQPSVAVA